MAEHKNFYVLKSSAGSGKTYALVRYYLTLALGSKDPSYYRQILAITFTNAAAAEMKDRVIQALTSFKAVKSGSQTPSLFGEIASSLGLQPHELRERAEQTLSHMLHNYGRIAISTIDSFTHRIVRSFARDLYLHPDFSIEMDTRAFSERIVDTCLDQVGTDTELTAYLEQFTLENFEDEKGTKVRTALEEVSSQLFNEDAKVVLDELESLRLSDYAALRRKWKTEAEEFEKILTEVAARAMELAEENALTVDDFAHKTTGAFGFFLKIRKGQFEIPGKRFSGDRTSASRWYSKSAAKPVIAKIEAIEDHLEMMREKIMHEFTSGHFQHYRLKRAALKVIYSMGMLSRLSAIAKQLKEEENTLLISDFQTIISEIVHESPAPFIYERVGERYNHILFDEFQDTSALQWQNFLPLIENALSKGNFNLIVGDGKQAIYRWRNGKAEQFVRLPEIDGDQLPERKLALRRNYEEGHLKTNYRSAQSIVRFNNSFYRLMEENTGSGITSEVYRNQAQESRRERTGYVRMDVLEESDRVLRRQQTLNRIIRIVEECRSAGYEYGDIAILTRKSGKEAGPIASALHAADINVVTKESFLLSNSSKVKLIMAFLRYMSQPDHLYSRVSIWQHLSLLFPDKFNLEHLTSHFTLHDERQTIPDTEKFLRTFYPGYSAISSLRSAVEIGESAIALFGISKDTFLEFLLDHLTRLSVSKEHSLREIGEWWEEHMHSLYISAQEGKDKVNIMTIHKSKGLQFPVVIYPRFSSGEPERTVWLDVDEEEFGIHKILYRHRKTIPEEGLPEPVLEDIEMHFMDQANLCYVATTRPEERLYMIVESDKADRISRMLIEYSAREMKAEGDFFHTGEPEPAMQKPAGKEHRFLLDGTVQASVDPVQLRYTALRERAEESQQKRIMGSLLHDCLAHIRIPADIEKAIHQVLPGYPMISSSRIPEIAGELLRICDHASVRDWFQSGLQVFNEQEILLADGSAIRPDRFIIRNDDCAVVDFKTGIPKPAHRIQVLKYRVELERITGKKTRAFLVYTDQMTVEEVED